MSARGACPGCAMDDDHPRHTLVMEDGATRSWHTDCHAPKGCPICVIMRDGAEGLTGQEYREHLAENAAEIEAAKDALPQDVHDTVFGVGV
jgi:hypothetical protein